VGSREGAGKWGNVLLTVAAHAGPNVTPGSVAVVRDGTGLVTAVEPAAVGQ
jgi:hypothetical protein